MEVKNKKKNIEVEKIVSRAKTLSGIVVSDKMKDTCVVLITRFVKHKKYKKYHKVSKKFKAHDVGNTKKIGDKVMIKECKPISKDKHFIIVK
ncbi:MAG: 30S ribosomal protein S17 [Patescibacteria group bacterium]